jgi:hypothetical protein
MPKKSKGGRPSKYQPEFCQTIIELGKEGASKAEMALACDIHRDTFDEWTRTIPEFSDAAYKARMESQVFWERKGRNGCERGHGFNGQTYQFLMKNMFRDDYRDKQEVEHTGDAFKEFLSGARKGAVPRAPNPHKKDEDDAD